MYMPEKPRELFNPGELSKTRKNIGTISSREAKKMTEILGGEIGIERTDARINERYKQISDQNRRKQDNRLLYYKPVDSLSSSLQGTHEGPPLRTKQINVVKQSYFQKIKLSFLAYQSIYRIKSFTNLISSFFSFFPGYKNKVNAGFINTLHSRIYKSIEKLVTSTRFMYAGIENKDLFTIKDPNSAVIIRIIIEWDIENLEKEIDRLKTFSRSVTVEACSNLIRKVYEPLILFSNVDTDTQVKHAIDYIYNRSIANLSKRNVKVTKLRKQYVQALGELSMVFVNIKYNLYPLLLFLISPKAYSYHDMLRYQGKSILKFLELKNSDLIQVKEIHQQSDMKEGNEATENEDEEEHSSQTVDIATTQGLFFLENLFPGSGWLKLKNGPDMVPYFQTILDLPADVTIIAPDDILQKVYILTSILKEFFPGFRSIRYGFMRDEKGTASDLKGLMDTLTDNWYHFLITLIEKNYLKTLTEYCRQLERDGSFPNSDYAHRMKADLLWLRKKYIFPHFYLDTPKIMQPRINLSIPELYENTKVLKNILERMVFELWNNEGIPVETILNPEEPVVFEIETEISKRLTAYFKKKNKRLINRNLILATLYIVIVLDYLMNNDQSPAYKDKTGYLYRSEGNLGSIPVYFVQPLSLPGKQESGVIDSIDPDAITGELDFLSGFPGSKALHIYLLQQIKRVEVGNEPFSLIRLESRDYHLPETSIQTRREIIREMTELISDSIRQFEDIPVRFSGDTIYIILPGTNCQGALKYIKRFFIQTREILPCFAGIVEYKMPMSEEEMLITVEKALVISKSFPAPMQTYLNSNTGKFDHLL